MIFFPGIEVQLVKLGQSVHQFCDRGAKVLNQLYLRDAAVFQGIVEQGSHQGLGIKFPVCALRSYRDRVGDVRLPTVAYLP